MVCSLIGVLAVVLLLWLIPPQNYEPKGILLPGRLVRAPISPEQVTIYPRALAKNYQVLGEIRVEQGFQTLDDETRDRLLQRVKQMAASVGANGVIVKFLSPDEGVRKVITFVGTAVYVSDFSL